MDNNLDQETENTPAQDICISCGSTDILAGHANKLCAACRTKHIKFPIPAWVKLFGAGVALIMLISIIWLPRNLAAALELSRAEKAEKDLNYVTAQNELEKARKIVPGSMDILSHLMIASFYNDDFKTVISVSGDLENKNIDDTTFFNKLNDVMIRARECFPSDSFMKYFDKYKKQTIPDTAYIGYLKKSPMDIFATYSLASSYADKEKYAMTDNLLSTCLNIDHNFTLALNLKTIVKRELNQLDSSIFYCDKLLSLNHQSAFALSSKARTLLKTGKNLQGMLLAEQCYDLDKTLPYNFATLAIAYHLNKDFKKRDAMISMAEKDTLSKSYMQYAKDVISNKVKFQN